MAELPSQRYAAGVARGDWQDDPAQRAVLVELDRLHAALRQPLVIDLRNLYEPEKMAAAGFEYVSIGRPAAAPAAPAKVVEAGPRRVSA